jgi:hypothetical protein
MSVEPAFAAQGNHLGGSSNNPLLTEMLPVTLIGSQTGGGLVFLATPNSLFPSHEQPPGECSASKNILGNPMEGYAIERLGRIPAG